MANTKVQSEQIEDGSITADKIADGAIVATELADNAVTTAKINADAVTGAKIADDAIDSEHYTDGSIDTAHIADAQITVAKMAANSVDSDQYVDGSIDTVHLGDLQVTTAKIANGNISTAKIADNAVTSAKIDTNIDIAGTFDVTGATTLDSTATVAGNLVVGGTNVDAAGTISLQSDGDIRGVLASGAGGDTIISAISGVSNGYQITVDSSNNQTYKWHNAGNVSMAIDSSGKVGIGTSSPRDKLHINIGTNLNWQFGYPNSNTTSLASLNDAESAYVDGRIDASNLILNSQSGGNVGIGTTSPSAPLHVTRTTSGYPILKLTQNGADQYNTIYLQNSNSTAATVVMGTGGGSVANTSWANNAVFGTTSDAKVVLLQNDSAAVTIDTDQYVTMPNQPYIRCAGNQASMANNQGTTADFSNWADQVQRGITRSGAVFTVPTAGEYLITYSFYNWINNSGGGVTHAIYLYKGAAVVQEVTAEYDFENDSYSYYDNHLGSSIILNMAAGDTFKFVAYADIYGGSTHTNMSAYLLG